MFNEYCNLIEREYFRLELVNQDFPINGFAQENRKLYGLSFEVYFHKKILIKKISENSRKTTHFVHFLPILQKINFSRKSTSVTFFCFLISITVQNVGKI